MTYAIFAAIAAMILAMVWLAWEIRVGDRDAVDALREIADAHRPRDVDARCRICGPSGGHYPCYTAALAHTALGET